MEDVEGASAVLGRPEKWAEGDWNVKSVEGTEVLRPWLDEADEGPPKIELWILESGVVPSLRRPAAVTELWRLLIFILADRLAFGPPTPDCEVDRFCELPVPAAEVAELVLL